MRDGDHKILNVFVERARVVRILLKTVDATNLSNFCGEQ